MCLLSGFSGDHEADHALLSELAVSITEGCSSSATTSPHAASVPTVLTGRRTSASDPLPLLVPPVPEALTGCRDSINNA